MRGPAAAAAAAIGGLTAVGVAAAVVLLPSVWPRVLRWLLGPPGAVGAEALEWRPPVFPFGTSLGDPQAAQVALVAARAHSRFTVHWLLWRPVLFINRLADAKEVLGPRITLQCSDRLIGTQMPLWGLLFGQALFVVGSVPWKRQHRLPLRAFGSRHTDSFFPTVERGARETVRRLVEHCAAPSLSQCDVVIQPYFGEYTLKTIVWIALGRRLVEGLPAVLRDLEEAIHYLSDPLFLLPGYLWLPFGKPRRAQAVASRLHAVARALVAEHRGAPRSPDRRDRPTDAPGQTFLELLCEAADAEDGRLTEEEVVHNTLGFVFAGYETTLTALTHVSFLLGEHPTLQEELYEEVAAAAPAWRNPKATAQQRWEALDGLRHLSAFLLETLRLFPPIVGLNGRTLHTDTTLGDLRCPKGLTLGINCLAQNADPELWGADGLDFRPSRFLPALEAHGGRAGPALEGFGAACVTFGGGIRPCVGRHLALMEMKAATAELLLHVRLIKADPHRVVFSRPLLRVPDDARVGVALRPTRPA